jgi:hypothetical protein
MKCVENYLWKGQWNLLGLEPEIFEDLFFAVMCASLLFEPKTCSDLKKFDVEIWFYKTWALVFCKWNHFSQALTQLLIKQRVKNPPKHTNFR